MTAIASIRGSCSIVVSGPPSVHDVEPPSCAAAPTPCTRRSREFGSTAHASLGALRSLASGYRSLALDIGTPCQEMSVKARFSLRNSR